MRQRILIAIALACEPFLFIADEPTTALDTTIQAQILDLLKKLKQDHELSILMITHDLGIVADLSDRVFIMYAGKIVEGADVYEIFKNPKHPYTIGLLRSALSIDEFNWRFSNFVNDIYHKNVHSSLGQSPQDKFLADLSKTTIRRIDENELERFFLCSIKRKVRRDATVRIDNIYYEVDMKYVGEMVDIRFPIDRPHLFYLFENDRFVEKLRPVDLVENANPPFVATSYSKLFKK